MSTATASSSKLRNSCDSCSSAKVGCGKEKPICGRCSKRGLECVYGATKRAGRTSHSKQLQQQQQQAQQQQQHALNPVIPVAPMSMTTGTTPTSSQSSQLLDTIAVPSITPSGNGFPFPIADLSHTANPSFPNPSFSPSYSDIFATLVHPPGSSTLTPNTTSAELDELLASVVSPVGGDLPNFDLSTAPVFDFGHIDDFTDPNNTAFLALTDNVNNDFAGTLSRNNSSDLSLFPQTMQPNLPIAPPTPRSSSLSTQGSVTGCSTPILTATEILPRRASVPLDEPCSCLKRALNLLAQHSIPAQRTGAETISRIKLPMFDQVVAQNEQTVEEVDRILKCPCSNDGYLLVVLSLLVFTVVSWYTAAASATPPTSQSGESPGSSREPIIERSSSVSTMDTDGEDQARLDAQLILSKLHAVQRLVNLLSNKIRGFEEDPRFGDVPVDNAVQALGRFFQPPFSGHLLRALESDMRGRLRELSRAIVSRLRNGW